LNEAVNALTEAVNLLEASPIIIKNFQGNVCLSNPKYDLYLDYGQVALGDIPTDERRRRRHLMDLLPALNRPASAQAIADQVGLLEGETLNYLQNCAAKGLIELL
jgi:hypothetical protein